jgi:hypothetical protein
MKHTLLSLLCLVNLAVFGQEEERVVIVKRESNRSYRHSKPERDIDNYNAFKFDPLRMTIGELNFSWEHRIDDNMTFEVELGPTISNLGGGRFYSDPTDPSFASYETHSQMGVLVSAAIRYYPLEDSKAMNKLYISPRMKYRAYNETYSTNYGGLTDQKGGSNEFIFSFNVGYQQWLSHNFAFDYYVGMGIGSFNGSRSYLGQTYDGNTNMWSYGWIEQKAQNASVVGVIGLKVTIGN